MAEYELSSEQFERLKQQLLRGGGNEFVYMDQGRYVFRAVSDSGGQGAGASLASVFPRADDSGERRYVITTDEPQVQRQVERMGVGPLPERHTVELTREQWEELRYSRFSGRGYDMSYGQNREYNIRQGRGSEPLASVRRIENEFTHGPMKPERYVITTSDPRIVADLRAMNVLPQAPRGPGERQAH